MNIDRAKFSRRLENEMEILGFNQRELAEKLKIKPNSISDYINQKSQPTVGRLMKIANILNVDMQYLAGQTDNKHAHLIKGAKKEFEIATTESFKIPILNEVRAGMPTLISNENIIDWEILSHDYKFKGELFGLRVKGDSMQPQMFEKDLLIIKRTNDIESGDVAIVLVNGDEATVKKVLKSDSGITLIPFNSSYEPIFYSNDDIMSKPVVIIGKVIEVRRKF